MKMCVFAMRNKAIFIAIIKKAHKQRNCFFTLGTGEEYTLQVVRTGKKPYIDQKHLIINHH